MRGPYAAQLALLLAASGPAVASASAWTRPAGTGYLKIWDRSLIGKGAYLRGRQTVPLPHVYQDHQLNGYAEWGVTDDFTAVLQTTLVGLAGYDGQWDPYFGGMTVSGRFQLQRAPIAVAAEVHLGARPHNSVVTGRAVVDGTTYEIRPVVGTLLAGGSLAAGRSFGDTWLTGQLGLRFHSAEVLEPAFFGYAQFGWHARDDLDLDLHLTWWHSRGDIEPVNVLGSGQTRYLGFGLSGTWWVGRRVGLHLGLEGAAFAYANAATPAVMLGVELR